MWSISIHNLASVSSLVHAQTVWDTAKPWRNEHASWRPLDGRRMRHKRLVKSSSGYECVLYNTPMVTYLADGGVKLNCHDTPSSTSFAYRVSPDGCSPLSHKGQMFWRVRTDSGDRYYCGDQLHLKPTAAGNWILVNEPSKQTEWAFDRKLGAQARKLVAPYTLWYTISQRMGVQLPSYEEPKNYKNSRIQELLQSPAEPEVISRVARHLGPPANARNSAYLHLGARYKQPVPSDRLPRS